MCVCVNKLLKGEAWWSLFRTAETCSFQKKIIYLFTAIVLSPGDSGYFTCIQNTKLVTNKLLLLLLLTAIGLSPGGSGYFTCKLNMKLVTTRFKSVGLHEKHVVATWNVGNRLSICL